MKRTIDIFPGNSFDDIAKIDIYFSECDFVYRGNIYNKEGKIIGNFSASDPLTLENMFSKLVFNWEIEG